MANERLFPKKFIEPFNVVLRHYKRYITSLELYGKLEENERWVDFGCGGGYGTSLLSNFSGQVIGYDRDLLCVEYATQTYKSFNVSFTSERDIIYYKSLKDATAIFMIEIIEHVYKEDAVKLLKDLREEINTSCKIIITTPLVSETNFHPTNKFHMIEYSFQDFENILLECGYKIDGFIIEPPVKFTDGEYKRQGFFKLGT